MKKIVVAAIVTIIAGSTSLLFSQAAKADRVIYCTPVTENRVLKESAADHPHAYADGYREGEQSARDRKPYKPRSVGGEFARGFEDGYFNKPYTGQEKIVPKTIVQHTTQVCDDNYYTVAPAPAYIYDPYVIYGSPYPIFDLNFRFGGGYHRWGHYRRW